MTDPGANPNIVLLAQAHLDEVAAIEREVSDVPWSYQLFADELTLVESTRHWLVATNKEDGDVLGFAGSMFVGHDAHLMNIAVRPANHRQGIAQKLMTQMMHDVRRGGFENMTLEVRPDNHGALALYDKFGMVADGVRKNYYPNGQDALVLWVHDIHTESYRLRLERIAEPC